MVFLSILYTHSPMRLQTYREGLFYMYVLKWHFCVQYNMHTQKFSLLTKRIFQHSRAVAKGIINENVEKLCCVLCE